MPTTASQQYVELLRGDFSAFIHRAFREMHPHAAYEDVWYIDRIAAKLERVRRGESKRVIINLPPRHLKSFIVSVVWPAWLLGHHPGMKILAISYGQDLADKLARDCRALMNSTFYRAVFPTRLSEDCNTVGEFETTEKGCRLASSMAGAVTGRGADIVIVDDPLKADEALS